MHEALDTARSGEGEMYTFLPLQDARIVPLGLKIIYPLIARIRNQLLAS